MWRWRCLGSKRFTKQFRTITHLNCRVKLNATCIDIDLFLFTYPQEFSLFLFVLIISNLQTYFTVTFHRIRLKKEAC